MTNKISFGKYLIRLDNLIWHYCAMFNVHDKEDDYEEEREENNNV